MLNFDSQTQQLDIKNQVMKRQAHMQPHDNSGFSISQDKVGQNIMFYKLSLRFLQEKSTSKFEIPLRSPLLLEANIMNMGRFQANQRGLPSCSQYRASPLILLTV